MCRAGGGRLSTELGVGGGNGDGMGAEGKEQGWGGVRSVLARILRSARWRNACSCPVCFPPDRGGSLLHWGRPLSPAGPQVSPQLCCGVQSSLLLPTNSTGLAPRERLQAGADRGLLQCHQPNSVPSCGDTGMGHSCTQAACPEVLSPGINPPERHSHRVTPTHCKPLGKAEHVPAAGMARRPWGEGLCWG